ncbi:hypothetical protein B1H10_04230 [candidate division KSB1 bacterium 4484_188]|nr:MAG: hypothetical protein B1H10_04230 [candidate division KSB1 bacterium 4484_188]HFE64304.1 rRNA pseudouridine synthase [Caldithrix sp.]
MTKKIRLNRYLAMCGLGSRRKCDLLIAAGGVFVNGEEITQMGRQIDPRRDVVEYQGQRVTPRDKPIYILLNKPLRTVTTASDEKKRKTVLDVVGIEQRIFPVGRLDYNTTGALLLTNDGDLAYYLAHPRYEISKIYRVLLNKRIRPIDLHRFRHGFELDGKKTAPCRAEELRILHNCSYLEVELHEGRNRQIRRMFEKLGYIVDELHRQEFAGLNVADLKPGQWRLLNSQEIQQLKKKVRSFQETAAEKNQ